MTGTSYGKEGIDATLPRKASQSDIRISVPETATGRLAENAKVREITLVKELGKIAL